jgi:metal-responsive CopG/Arc/MetJ family transcriptional regulator
MSVINFTIHKELERRVKEAIRKRGFSNRAELFRFAVIRYLDEDERLSLDGNQKIAALSDELEQELISKIDSKPLPSIEKQLARMKNL